MLQNIRDNSTGLFAKIIIGLIALTFVVTGIQFVSFGGGESEVAVVNDRPITESEFFSEVERQRRQLLQFVPNPALIDEQALRGQVLETLITDAAVLTEAQQRGLSIDDRQLDPLLLAEPAFQTDGAFDPVRFDSTIAQAGYTRLSFRAFLQDRLTAEQWLQGVSASSFSVPVAAQQALALEGQTRTVRLAAFPAGDQVVAAPSAADLEALFEKTQDQWQQPEQLVVEYVVLDAQADLDLAAVDEAEVREAYDRYVESLEASNEKRASHILLQGDDAQAQAQAALDRLNAGEAFDALARELSQDSLSAANGGDLGFAPEGTYVPEFEAALNALATGEISEPVTTPFGVHLIRLEESRAQAAEPFELRSGLIRRELAEQAARLAYEAKAEELANIAFAGSLEEARDELGLRIETSEPFSQAEGRGIFEEPALRQIAFGEEVREQGENSELIEIEEGGVVLRVVDDQPARPLTLSEVTEPLTALYLERARSEAALAKAQAAQPEALGDVVELARAGGELPQDLVAEVFALPKNAPGVTAVSLSNGDAYAVELVSVQAGDDAELDSMLGFLASQQAQRAGQNASEYARANAVVER